MAGEFFTEIQRVNTVIAGGWVQTLGQLQTVTLARSAMKSILIAFAAVAVLSSFGRDAVEPVRARKPIGRAELYWLMNRSCWYGDEISVQMLLDAGADPNGVKDMQSFGDLNLAGRSTKRRGAVTPRSWSYS